MIGSRFIWQIALLLLVGLASGCGAERTVNNAINEVKVANKNFADLNATLAKTAKNLDEGIYKEQVKEIADRASQVAQLGIEGSFDFTRSRVIDDLENLKRSLSGKPMLQRIPVLSNAGVSDIDRTSASRTSVTVVGWNLDVAQKDKQKYKVRIENENEANSRDVNFIHVTFGGQYAVTVDVSSSGIPLQDHDKKLVFQGFDPVFEIAIINTNPVPRELIVAVSGNIRTTDQDREGGFCILALMDGATEVWRYQFPEFPQWGDGHSQPFAFDIPSIPVPVDARFLIYLSQAGARERNILWRFDADAHFRGNRGTVIGFAQNGLSLRCGDGGPATVATAINRLP